MTNPIKSFLDIRKDEVAQSLLMFSYFFLVITSFWILKPVKKSLFITYYHETGFFFGAWQMTGAQAELLAKLLNMGVAYVAATVFAWLSNRFVRQQLTVIFSAFFILCYIGFALRLDYPSGPIVWSFYLFGDLFSTLMVAAFFVFLNDIVTPDQAKRTYGLVGLGGVLGGVIGSTAVSGWISRLETSSWMMVCLLLAILIIGIAIAVGKIAAGRKRAVITAKEPQAPARESSANPAVEGAILVFRSRYLLAIVGIVGIYEMVSTIMDYQFTETVSHFLVGDAIGQQFATVYSITNTAAMVVQLFLTGYIMKQHGVKIALFVLPVAALFGSVAFMAVPILWIGSLLNTADNAFSYSINQSAKESLYVPTTQKEKYAAKAFVDMFVQRVAKAVAVFLSLGITAIAYEFSAVRWLSLLTVILTCLWLLVARYAGRCFDKLADAHNEEGSKAQTTV
jgi:AAA family ATP:ADP antiporter